MQSSSHHEHNTPLGLRLFLIYSLFYFGFVLVMAFAPQWSEWVPFAGLNLAVLWGFSLIFLAFIMAMIYGVYCKPDEPNRGSEE